MEFISKVNNMVPRLTNLNFTLQLPLDYMEFEYDGTIVLV